MGARGRGRARRGGQGARGGRSGAAGAAPASLFAVRLPHACELRPAVRTLRHLDVLRTPGLLRLEVRRLACPSFGVIAEELPFARAGSRAPSRTVASGWRGTLRRRSSPGSMRIDWATVGRMIERVVAEALAGGEDALAGLRRIGIDEVSYRKGPSG